MSDFVILKATLPLATLENHWDNDHLTDWFWNPPRDKERLPPDTELVAGLQVRIREHDSQGSDGSAEYALHCACDFALSADELAWNKDHLMPAEYPPSVRFQWARAALQQPGCRSFWGDLLPELFGRLRLSQAQLIRVSQHLDEQASAETQQALRSLLAKGPDRNTNSGSTFLSVLQNMTSGQTRTKSLQETLDRARENGRRKIASF